MTKPINLCDTSSHPLATTFRDLMGQIEMLGASPEITECVSTLSRLRDDVQSALRGYAATQSTLDEIGELATTETDNGPVFNLSFLDSPRAAQRFIELLSI